MQNGANARLQVIAMFRGLFGSSRVRAFYLGDDPVTPVKFGHMAVELSIHPAKNIIESFISFPHKQEDGSLIYRIEKDPDFAITNFWTLAVATHLAYVALYVTGEEDVSRQMGDGVKEAAAARMPDHDTSFFPRLTGT